MLGSIDANTGSPDLGWDTDQFPMDVKAATMVMKTVIEQVRSRIAPTTCKGPLYNMPVFSIVEILKINTYSLLVLSVSWSRSNLLADPN